MLKPFETTFENLCYINHMILVFGTAWVTFANCQAPELETRAFSAVREDVQKTCFKV